MGRAHLNTHYPGRPPEVTIVLSRRNLLALLQKLTMKHSAKTLLIGDVYIDNEPSQANVRVISEDDEAHYKNRSEPPGTLHEQTQLELNSEMNKVGYERVQTVLTEVLERDNLPEDERDQILDVMDILTGWCGPHYRQSTQKDEA